MMAVARTLAQPFDMVRVDLYSIRNSIYFGELTHYPLSGLVRLEPESFDFDLGGCWELKPSYWTKCPALALADHSISSQPEPELQDRFHIGAED